MRLTRCTALLACFLIDAAAVGRVFAQQTAPRAPRVLTIRSGGSYLGVGVEDIDEDRAKALRLPEVRGVEIKSVEDNSPAAKAGLLKGDVVLEFNAQRVEGTEQFVRMVREIPGGHKITLQIIRNGAPQTVTAVTSGHSTGQSWPSPLLEGNNWNFPTSPDVPMPAMPRMPALPRAPMDLPRPMMSWQNGSVGIEAEPLSGQLAEYFGVKEGVLIRSVIHNSPAEKAGLKAGDVVVKINGEQVGSPGDVSARLHGSSGRHPLAFALMRNHREMTVSVTVTDGWQNRENEESF